MTDSRAKGARGEREAAVSPYRRQVILCSVPEAYTIGNHLNYDPLFTGDTHPSKVGRTEDYGGGWVWHSREAAQTFIDSTDPPFPAKVYGLLLPQGWDYDVSPEPDPDDGVHRLLTDAPLVQLPEQEP